MPVDDQPCDVHYTVIHRWRCDECFNRLPPVYRNCLILAMHAHQTSFFYFSSTPYSPPLPILFLLLFQSLHTLSYLSSTFLLLISYFSPTSLLLSSVSLYLSSSPFFSPPQPLLFHCLIPHSFPLLFLSIYSLSSFFCFSPFASFSSYSSILFPFLLLMIFLLSILFSSFSSRYYV